MEIHSKIDKKRLSNHFYGLLQPHSPGSVDRGGLPCETLKNGSLENGESGDGDEGGRSVSSNNFTPSSEKM